MAVVDLKPILRTCRTREKRSGQKRGDREAMGWQHYPLHRQAFCYLFSNLMKYYIEDSTHAHIISF